MGGLRVRIIGEVEDIKAADDELERDRGII